MTERQIVPRDVFARSSMPSRWERLTGVSPKTAPDRKYLAFIAARYRGEDRLPAPDALDVPTAVAVRHRTQLAGWSLAALAAGGVALGWSAEMLAVVAVASALLVCVLAVMLVVAHKTEPRVAQYQELLRRSEDADQRMHADSLAAEDSATLKTMIGCDEGSLAYCAARIAAEIEQDPAWDAGSVGFVPIDLFDELAQIGASARQIATDREESEHLERGPLRTDPQIRAVIAEEKRQRTDAITILATRVHAFADYRDRILRHGALTRRDTATVDRIVRRVVDEQAGDHLR